MNKYIKALTILVFVFIIFSFYEWKINPGDWHTGSRIGATIMFALLGIAELQEETKN
ncbi:hypothetical protein SAMN05443667_101268 [Flavobacterium gillisiae]|uniref:Uncharacterized protein n=1 Tax=Flavobacterium gillisiae TaxID=150146 RepID=A0A1H3WW35_9FLAO|nr:hypothetical protein [Flavobacterium gillisiae]SDZ91339.1 hypothetical protein SAMN05443667_101268 [Flavobacterium gillisiae]